MLFLIWLSLFIPFGAISLLFSSSILDPYRPRSVSFSVISFCLFILLMRLSRQECWSGLPFPSPADHALSELPTVTRPYGVAAAAAAKLLQLCPTLCDPIDGSPPGSAIPGILQARTLEWVAISFSCVWKWKTRVKLLQLCPILCDPMDCSLPGSSIHGIFQASVLEWVAIAFSTYGVAHVSAGIYPRSTKIVQDLQFNQHDIPH